MAHSVYLLPISIILILLFYNCYSQNIPSKMLCADARCEEFISTATTKLSYRANEEFLLSFPSNIKVDVLAKPENKKDPYWGVMIKNKFGFIPSQHIRETKVFIKDPKFSIPGDKVHKILMYLERVSQKPADEHEIYQRKKVPKQVNEKDQISPPEKLKLDDQQKKIEAIEILKEPDILHHAKDENITDTESVESDSENMSTNEEVTKEVKDTIVKLETADDDEESDDDEDDDDDSSDYYIVKNEQEESTVDSPELVSLDHKLEEKDNSTDEQSESSEIDPTETNIVQKNNENNDFNLNSVTISPDINNENQKVEVNLKNITSETNEKLENENENIAGASEKIDNKYENIESNVTDQSLSEENKGEMPVSDNIIKTDKNLPNINYTNETEISGEITSENNDNVTLLSTLNNISEHENLLLDNSTTLNKEEEKEEKKEIDVKDTFSEKKDVPINSDMHLNVPHYIKKMGGNINSFSSNKIKNDNINNYDVNDKQIEEIIDQRNETLESNITENIFFDNQNSLREDQKHEINNIDTADLNASEVPYVEETNNENENFNFSTNIVDIEPTTEINNIEDNESILVDSEAVTENIMQTLNDDNKNYLDEKESIENLNVQFEDSREPEYPSNSRIIDSDESYNNHDQIAYTSDTNNNEKSFSFLSLTAFSSVFESISNVFKSDPTNEQINNVNKNILASDKINDLKEHDDEFSNVDNSQSFFSSLFPESSQCIIEKKVKGNWSDVSADLIFWLIISAVSVLMFTLGYYYLENKKQDGKLLAMVNSLQKELLCSSKECIILKEELVITKEKLIAIEDSSFGSNEMVASLKEELAESQQNLVELQEKLTVAEEELANSTEAAFELQSILNEQLMSNDKSNSLAFTITQLQSQLDDQQTSMNSIKSQLAIKVEENELLMAKIIESNNKLSSMENELINTREILTQAVNDSENKSRQIQEFTSNLEKNIQQLENQKKIEIHEIQLQLDSYKEDLNKSNAVSKAHLQEIKALQDSIKSLQSGETDIESILDMSHTKAELVLLTSEKSRLLEKLNTYQTTVNELSEKLDKQSEDIGETKEKLTEAEQKALEATTRLEVLTNYFNQKEADLLKELNVKETLWVSQQGEAMSTTEKIESIQKEIQQYKETTESMKREVAEQEAAWRARVAALEQRAHEQWLARRAAERAAEASAREAQALRQRLAAPSPDKRVVSPINSSEPLTESNFMSPIGALGSMLPPPPLGFLPPPLGGPMMLPPPLPPLPPHRPPPLGRLSSPPPLPPMRQDRSYSPDSRYSPDREYSPQHRGRSPFSNQDNRRRNYNNRRYDNRYYDSEEDRRSRRYETETDFSPINTVPPSPVPQSRNHKGVSSGSGQSYESLERFK